MKVACGQMRAVTINDAASVWPIVERHAEQAHQAGADLLVLPETTYPAYWLESVERYLREDIERSAAVLTRFGQIARRHAMWLVAGFVEEREGKLHNSAAVFDRRGELIHIARKSFLWDCDNRWFEPGWQIAAFDSEFGRMGVLICADCRAPEVAATLVSDGARILLLPTAWVNAGPRGIYRNVHPEFLVRARAMEFGVPIVCCSKSGAEADKLEYVGQSRVVDARGETLATAPAEGDPLIVADVSPGRPRPPHPSESDMSRLFAPPAAVPIDRHGTQVEVNPAGAIDAVMTKLVNAGGRMAILESADAESFVRARCEAMQGASILWFDGPPVDEALLRARAAENRVFVVAADERIRLMVSPDGGIAWREASENSKTADAPVQLNLADAEVKLYTPSTNLWIQRRVACYRLGRPPEPETIACTSGSPARPA
ncbi:MAG: hypothetical protein HBSAPP02_08820 [Phycisphaerae bacterium]|nr:MAG: carbon-nitrogen hydrolase family protein [Planctomycetia bacterium]GJQ25850.1 MAG: hypothetical protein HBSAPP02_08820 [Phycisphaerae bacterium]